MTTYPTKDRRVLPLATRIEAWIRLQILGGAIDAGARLPSPEHLAERFDVNVNTAREAYARLAAEGIVDIRHGKGVYGAMLVTPQRAQGVRELMAEMQARAAALELSCEDVAMLLWAYGRDRSVGQRIWLVDNAHPYRQSFVGAIEATFREPARLLDLDDLDAGRAADLPRADDIVITRFRYVDSVRRLLADAGPQVFPVRTRVDAASMMQLAALPKDSRLGCVCVADRFAQSLGRAIRRHHVELPQAFAAVDDDAALDRIYTDCDVVATSCAGFDGLNRRFGKSLPKPTVTLVFELDPESLAIVRDMVGDQKVSASRAVAPVEAPAARRLGVR